MIVLDWKEVEVELQEFLYGRRTFDDLSPLSQDTLYGVMWGMNIRYTTIKDALINNWETLPDLALKGVQALRLKEGITQGITKPMALSGVGFGTYGWKYDSRIIEVALKNNVTLIDTAEGYGFGKVETELGKILRELPDPPKNITTKVSRNHMSLNALMGAALRSNEKLGVVPHYQLHFPNCFQTDSQLGRVLMRLKDAKKIQSIGLGNCSVAMIESMRRFLIKTYKEDIYSVQVSYSLIDRRIESALLPYCRENDITVIAYSPLGQSFKKLNRPVLSKIAKQYGATPAQVALSWILNRDGIVPIPRTNDEKHLMENLEASKLFLLKEDVETLNNEYKP